MSFDACSPVAGRFHVKESASLRSRDVAGHFSRQKPLKNTYPRMYGKDSLYQALDK